MSTTATVDELKGIIEGEYSFKVLIKTDYVSVLLARRLDYAIALVGDPLSRLYVLRYLPRDMLRDLIEKRLLRHDITAHISTRDGVEITLGKVKLRCKARARYRRINVRDIEARVYRVRVYGCELE